MASVPPPDRIRVASRSLAEAIEQRCGGRLPVVVGPTDDLDQVFQDFAEHTSEGATVVRSYLERGRIGAADVARLFEAAASLYRTAPWSLVDDSEVRLAFDGAAGGADSYLLPVRTTKRGGRNDPCPCGSGRKYARSGPRGRRSRRSSRARVPSSSSRRSAPGMTAPGGASYHVAKAGVNARLLRFHGDVILQGIPLGRAAVFLASDDGSWVTRKILRVDGGAWM